MFWKYSVTIQIRVINIGPRGMFRIINYMVLYLVTIPAYTVMISLNFFPLV